MAKTYTGIVASNKGNKTIIVTILSRKTHPVYKKQYPASKRFMAHDESNQAKMGDKVVIAETKPISAKKKHILLSILERAVIRHEETFELPHTKQKPADTVTGNDTAKEKVKK